MITTTSKYALRALVRMATLPKDDLIGGKDLSEQMTIPANYLSKVMLTLRNAGLVEATRGCGGGYRLQTRPRDIRLIDVVELFEGVFTRPLCFLGENHVCSDETPCAAHDRFKSARAAYITFLEKTSIAMLAKQAAELEC